MTLLYKLTSDDGSTANFHNKWDKGSTLTLIRNTKDIVLENLLIKVG